MISASGGPFEQGVLRGVRGYAARQPAWQLRLLRLGHPVRAVDLQGLDIDGFLSRTSEPAHPSWVSQPMVLIGYEAPADTFSVTSDEAAAGALAADHLVGQHLRQLLYFFAGNLKSSPERWSGFRRAAAAHGVACERFFEGPRTRTRGTWQLSDQLADLAEVLQRLPKPIGLCASNDAHGERAVAAARLAGLRVPDDVAVVCHSMDAGFCDLTDPPLSSVSADAADVGHAAATMLDALMAGQTVATRRVRVPPQPVVERQSSNFIAVADPLVDQALRTIRAHIADLPDVPALVDRLPTSRPTLERRFRTALGLSPAQQMRRDRVRLTKQLLRESDESLAVLAARTGFGGIWQLCRQIKQDTGLTPTAYRAQFK